MVLVVSQFAAAGTSRRPRRFRPRRPRLVLANEFEQCSTSLMFGGVSVRSSLMMLVVSQLMMLVVSHFAAAGTSRRRPRGPRR